MREMNYTYRILDLLKAYPNGLRLRSIGAKLGVWHPSLAKDIAELESKGQIVGTLHRDMANMEQYYIWKLVEKKNTNLGKGVDNNPFPWYNKDTIKERK